MNVAHMNPDWPDIVEYDEDYTDQPIRVKKKVGIQSIIYIARTATATHCLLKKTREFLWASQRPHGYATATGITSL